MAISRGPKIITNGLVLALDAADRNSYSGSGTSWIDLSGNRSNGTLTNGPTFSASNGGSIIFDGVNDLVSLTNTTKLQFTNLQPYSISAWVYWTETTNVVSAVFSYSTSTSPYRGYYLSLDRGALKSQSFLFDYFDGTYYKSIQGNIGVVPLNTWINICGTCPYNHLTATNAAKFYINGVLSSYTDRSTAISSPLSINYAGLTSVIGNRGATAFQPFKGNIANVSVYNVELTNTQVLQNYNTIKSRFNL